MISDINNRVVFILGIFTIVVKCQQYVGDLCASQSTQTQGVCKVLSECPYAQKELQQFSRFPQTCGFQGTQPIVCCPSENVEVTTTSAPKTTSTPKRNPGDISLEKCREYSKYIYERSRPPILLLGAEETVKNECGHTVVELIVGGEVAKRREFPHSVVIGYEPNPGDVKWLCGGTIISEQFVLTAGHCLISREFGDSKYVRMGMVNINAAAHRQEFLINARIKHPEYTPSSHYNDIGLIKLERVAKLNSYARPACLYNKPVVQARKAIATGFGRTQFAGVSSEQLLKVTLDLSGHKDCNHSYRNQISRRLNRGIVDESQLCAGSLDEEKDTCQGDSGGPLQIYHTNDDIICMYDIIGVTSFGKACSGSYGVYTRISNYIKWIEDVVWP